MRQQSVPAVGGDVIRLDGVTKTYQAGPPGGGPPLGSTLSVTGAPGAPALTVALRAE